MGIFDRKEKIPEPHVVIQLDEGCQGPFSPGTPISGLATLQSPAPRELQLVKIFFTGKSVTHNIRRQSTNAGPNQSSKTIHYHDEARLFQLDQILSQEIMLEQDVPYTFRFSFAFPSHTPELLGPPPYSGKSERKQIYASNGHLLPPSFHHVRTENRYAIVEYNLEVIFQFPDSKKPLTFPLQPLEFMPTPSQVQPDLIEFRSTPQTYSSSRLVGAEKSFMHSIRDSFSSKTPSVRIDMRASIPSHISASSAFQIFTCVNVSQFSQEGIQVASVKVWIDSLKLLPMTFYRALRAHNNIFGSYANEHEEIDEDKLSLNSLPESMVVDAPVGSDVKGNITFPSTFEARIPGSVSPSFETFNIVQCYRLKVAIRAEVCGKVFENRDEVTIILMPVRRF